MEKLTSDEVHALLVHNAYSLAVEFERGEPDATKGAIIIGRLRDLLNELTRKPH